MGNNPSQLDELIFFRGVGVPPTRYFLYEHEHGKFHDSLTPINSAHRWHELSSSKREITIFFFWHALSMSQQKNQFVDANDIPNKTSIIYIQFWGKF